MKKWFLKIVAIFAVMTATVALAGCGEVFMPSAYQLALENGFQGTEAEWLLSLTCPHSDGKSAYEIALENGFVGSEAEWLETLKGDPATGKSAYEIAVEYGYKGTEKEWLDSLTCKGPHGKSAYDIAVENGFNGTEEEWLASLKGLDGEDGEDMDINAMYEAAKADGYEGSMSDFLKEYFSIEVGQNTDTKIVADNLLSSVSIYCTFTLPDGSRGVSSGSGVIYHLEKAVGRAYIITNYHVVYENNTARGDDTFDEAFIYLYGAKNGLASDTFTDETGNPMMGRLVGGSPENDIAVLAVEDSEVLKNSNARAAKMRSESDPIRLGEKVRVVGNAGGRGISVTEGVLSAESENIELVSLLDPTKLATHRVMRTDAIINKGNSGGGLFDANGYLVGIVNAKSTSANLVNMGYAIPANKVERIAAEVIQKGSVDKALLGVQLYLQSSSAVVDNYGNVSVEETIIVDIPAVSPESSAYGVFEVGDIIKEVRTAKESLRVTRLYHVGDFLISVEAGDTLTIVIERGGVEMEKQITMTQAHMKKI